MNNGKYSPEMVQEICKYLRAGNSQKDSALLAGLAVSTFYDWQREKESDGKPNPSYKVDFVEALKKAEVECKARNIAIIQQAGVKQWQAAAWWLERKYNNEFALKNIFEHGNKDDKPLMIRIIPENDNRITNQKLPETTGDI